VLAEAPGGEMKKSAWLIMLLTAALAASAFSENLDTDRETMSSALFIKPLSIIEYAKKSYFGMGIESQSALNSMYGLKTIEDYYANAKQFNVNLALGPQVNIGNDFLEGLLIGIYPGLCFTSTDESYAFAPELLGEITYNRILYRNLGVGLYLIADFWRFSSYSIGVKIGYYLPGHNMPHKSK
jgi:hypothetical protein